jgi:Uma2 family endonuclease
MLVTVQDFLQMPESEDERLELIGGEVVGMSQAGYPHEVTKSNIIRVLSAWCLQNLGLRLLCETSYQLDDRNCLIPDISLITEERIVPGTRGVFQGAPEIAIEVVSSESAARLEDKIELYLACGGKSVWVVYPERRAVLIDTVDGTKKFRRDQMLVDPTVLPGFSVPASAIFQGV